MSFSDENLKIALLPVKFSLKYSSTVLSGINHQQSIFTMIKHKNVALLTTIIHDSLLKAHASIFKVREPKLCYI